MAKAFGKECLSCDGMAETLVRDLDTYLRMQADPEYLEKIIPDEAAFMDKSKLEFTIGYEYAIIEDGKAVKTGVKVWYIDANTEKENR